MKRVTLHTNEQPLALSWLDDRLIDWATGREYLLSGEVRELGTGDYGTSFDSAITSEDGVYTIIYQMFGTKGILLKQGKMLRVLSRSNYHADIYEYPIAFVKAMDGHTYLIHCPTEYNELNFEEVKNGRLVYNFPRKANDFFHSCLQVSPDRRTLVDMGWVWQPFIEMEMFAIEDCIQNPTLLDKSKVIETGKLIGIACEVYAGSFIDNDLMILNFMDESDKTQNGIWNSKTHEMEEILQWDFPVGRYLTVIDDTLAWDFYQYPKLFNFRTG